MSNEGPVNYEAVLADLIARRDQLNAAIEVIRPFANGALPTVSQTQPAARPATVQPDDFFGMTIVEASKKYLAMMKRPQSSPTIAEALNNGGYLFTSDSPVQTVNSLLNRSDKQGGDIVRVGKGMFGLAEWYPNRPRRRRITEDANGNVTVDSDAIDPFEEGDSPPPEPKGNENDLA